MSDTKLQWSQFQGKQEQVVIRCDDEKEFDELVKKYKEGETTPKGNPQVKATPYQSAPVDSQETKDAMDNVPCKKCGAKQILSKKGNWVCSDFCWTK